MKLKIFFLIPSLAGGGAERVFVNLVKEIDKSIFDVTLVYLSDERNVYSVPSNIRVINLRTKRVRNSPLKIIRLIRAEKPDLLISTQGHLNILILMLKRFYPKKTRVIIRQTSIMSLSRRENTSMLQKKIKAKLYQKADKIICQSEYMKNDFISSTGVTEDKVIKIFNPVDIQSVLSEAYKNVEFEINTKNKNIFFVGRLNEVKRIPLIIDAFEKFYFKNPDTNLYILGDGEQKQYLINYIKKKRLEKNIHLLGFQQNPYKFLKHADLFVMASKHEGMPNVLIEVLTLNIPVLILKHPGGTIDILKSVELEDRFVDSLLINEDSFKRYKMDISKKIYENFGLEKIVKEYEQVFIEFCNKRR